MMSNLQNLSKQNGFISCLALVCTFPENKSVGCDAKQSIFILIVHIYTVVMHNSNNVSAFDMSAQKELELQLK